ncbi:hypothetical protein [Sinomonas albida]|uniref:hypothetical protein n=1 Tax=Sinomonas albida TaxID=369942 RepID=UPI003018B454
MFFATNKDDMIRQIFTSVLPLLGTWVGTVLAYYFSRENLRTATASTAQLLGLKSTVRLVTDVMLPRVRMIIPPIPAGGVDALKLADLYNQMVSAGVMRLPILDDGNVAHYVVHKSTLDAFAKTLNIVPPAFPDDKTMGTLSSDPQLGKLVKAMGFVGPQALLTEAQQKIRDIPNCNDVFVTTNGKDADPVIGWLTNTDLAGQA